MVVEVRDQPGRGGHFETNSDQLTEQAQRYFSAIADSYNTRVRANSIADPKEKADYIAQVSKRKILLIGHTDDTGSSRLNADLSERRARAVAAYMEKRGIPQESLYFQGAGESYPIADNNTEEGRIKNRRWKIAGVVTQRGRSRGDATALCRALVSMTRRLRWRWRPVMMARTRARQLARGRDH